MARIKAQRNPRRSEHVRAAEQRLAIARGQLRDAEAAWTRGDPEEYYRQLLQAYRHAALADAHLEHSASDADPVARDLWGEAMSLSETIQEYLLAYVEVGPYEAPPDPHRRPHLRLVGPAHDNPGEAAADVEPRFRVEWAPFPEHGITVRMSIDGIAVGRVTAHERLRFVECAAEEAKLRAAGFSDARAFVVVGAIVLDPHRGQGYGKRLYEAMLSALASRYGKVLVAPDRCSAGGTSPDAMRVWRSLARRHRSAGVVIGVQDLGAHDNPANRDLRREVLSW